MNSSFAPFALTTCVSPGGPIGPPGPVAFDAKATSDTTRYEPVYVPDSELGRVCPEKKSDGEKIFKGAEVQVPLTESTGLNVTVIAVSRYDPATTSDTFPVQLEGFP